MWIVEFRYWSLQKMNKKQFRSKKAAWKWIDENEEVFQSYSVYKKG